MEVITVSATSFKCFSKSFMRRISNYLEVICFKEKEFISFLHFPSQLCTYYNHVRVLNKVFLLRICKTTSGNNNNI